MYFQNVGVIGACGVLCRAAERIWATILVTFAVNRRYLNLAFIKKKNAL